MSRWSGTVTFGGNNTFSGIQIGQNHGTVNAQSHLPPGTKCRRLYRQVLKRDDLERVETPPAPFSSVPFPRDQDYIDRTGLTDVLHENLSLPAARVALCGLGGIG